MRDNKMKMIIRRKSRFRYKNELKAGLVIILLALFVFLGVKLYKDRPLPIVTLHVVDAEMRAEGEVPTIYVEASREEESKNVVLDKATGYSLDDFIDDVNAGEGYVIEHDTDLAEEGSYTLFVRLNDEMKEKYESGWNKKAEFIFKTGHLVVKSQYGDWEDNKFLLLDGTYASGWFNIGKHTYYFNEDNMYVTGEQTIGSKTYYFTDDDKFDEDKNPVNPNKPMVALTFDDGPGMYTMKLLEALEEHDAKATFYMLAPRVNAYPEAIKRMQEIGCELGNHSTSHVQLTKVSASEVSYEIETTNNALRNVVGVGASSIRPPYGSVNGTVRSVANLPIILWSIDTLDWESKDVEKIKESVRTSVKDGDIILMHDIYETTVDAAIALIPELQEAGFQLVTVAELAEYKGVTLENGSSYRQFN